MKNSLYRNNKGFSLLEMVVAVLIMAIMAGAAIVAFNSVYNAQTSAASRVIADGMKQTRTKALGLVNTTNANNVSNVYAKFYKSGSSYFIDVCSNYGGSETVFSSEKICSDRLNIRFCNVSGATVTDLVTVGDGTGTEPIVRVYFRKETGGISLIVKTDNYGNFSDSDAVLANNIRVINPNNTSEYRDIIMVDITGRCYVDE